MAAPEHNSGLSNSFTDLMTSMAVIFILLLCASLYNAQGEGEASRNNVLQELQRELKDFAKTGVEVKSDKNDPLGLLILVPEGLLEFKVDKADIPARGEVFLQSFIPKLANVVCSDRFVGDINSIVVEGHTDSTGTDQHNWELSQRRSMAVVRSSLEVLDTKTLEHDRGHFLEFLSASGRGRAEPVLNESGAENRAMSRRVVFKIRVRSLEQKGIVEVLRGGGG